jgi:hypothetical protein
MADVRYLVTVDSETGVLTKLELVGDAEELTEVDLSKLYVEVKLPERGHPLFRLIAIPPSPRPGR